MLRSLKKWILFCEEHNVASKNVVCVPEELTLRFVDCMGTMLSSVVIKKYLITFEKSVLVIVMAVAGREDDLFTN